MKEIKSYEQKTSETSHRFVSISICIENLDLHSTAHSFFDVLALFLFHCFLINENKKGFFCCCRENCNASMRWTKLQNNRKERKKINYNVEYYAVLVIYFVCINSPPCHLLFWWRRRMLLVHPIAISMDIFSTCNKWCNEVFGFDLITSTVRRISSCWTARALWKSANCSI